MHPMNNEVFAFGPFRLYRAERVLLQDGKRVRLGDRSLDILIMLVERVGETVVKDQLIDRVWPDTAVDESALRAHLTALRKVLGDGRDGNRFIITVAGRGYSFVAPVAREHHQEIAVLPKRPVGGGNLPTQLTRVIGRAEVVATVGTRIAQQRLLTIVGPGGIGKTTVAVAAAQALGSSYPDGVWFVGLASLQDPALVPSAISTSLGNTPGAGDPLSSLIAWLRDKHVLIILDSCEHIISAAAAITEAVLKAAPQVAILVTSREPLRAEGEWLLRVPPLEVPPATNGLTAAAALGFPAVELFNERATAALDSFVLADSDLPTTIEICRRLDGVPLAIELAAAQVGVLGIGGLAEGLDKRLSVLTTGRRTAPPRQQTLRATIDWSYGLLSEDEQRFFRALGIFTGGFTVEAAAAVVLDAVKTPRDAIDRLADLVAKSLVVADVSGAQPRFRLLDTTRAYAIEQLDASGDRERIARRHAEYHLSLFERAEAEAEAEARPAAEWLAEYRPRIDNLRAALDWAFSPSGEAAIGVALTAASVPLWVDLSMMAECRRHVERALARLDSVANLDPRREMHLRAGLGVSLNYTTGPVSETEAAWTRTLEVAESLDDVEYQLRALRGLWAHRVNAGEYRASLAIAYKFGELAATAGDPAALGAADRMAGIILHYLGDQSGARQHLERRLARTGSPVGSAIRFLIDQRVATRSLLARILWLQGFPDQAATSARLAVDEAEVSGHALSLCHALAQAACPVAALNGDVEAAASFTSILVDRSKELGLAGWIARGHCYQGVVLIMHADFAAGLPLLSDALDELHEGGAVPGYPAFLAIFASGLGLAGQAIQGLAVVDQALELSERHEERWCLPEVLRNKGELLLLEGSVGAALAAEDYFRQALDWARRDATLSYELRAAISLGRLWRHLGRGTEAHDLIASVYGRFTEGFETADLVAAKGLLQELRAGSP